MDRMKMAMTPKAPGAATPGSGAGNVPFAPGLISGNLGQGNNPAPQTPHPQGNGGITLNIGQQGPPPEKPPALPPTPMPQQPQQLISPDTYFNVLNAYMNALLQSVEEGKPLVGGIY